MRAASTQPEVPPPTITKSAESPPGGAGEEGGLGVGGGGGEGEGGAGGGEGGGGVGAGGVGEAGLPPLEVGLAPRGRRARVD